LGTVILRSGRLLTWVETSISLLGHLLIFETWVKLITGSIRLNLWPWFNRELILTNLIRIHFGVRVRGQILLNLGMPQLLFWGVKLQCCWFLIGEEYPTTLK
jgi:hypothetical protein